MSGELRNFDPERITAVWAIRGGKAVDLTQGLIDAPGAMTETKDSAKWTRKSDRQGNTVRNRSGKRGAALTCTYAAEAPIHGELAAILELDDALGTMVGDIVVRDLEGTTLVTYVSAFIEDDPAMAYGDTAGDRVYVFGCAERIALFGGSTPR